MAAERFVVVAVHTERLLTDYAGLWCTACALPSGVRTWFAVSLGMRMHLRLVLWCDECGSQETVVDDAAAT